MRQIVEHTKNLRFFNLIEAFYFERKRLILDTNFESLEEQVILKLLSMCERVCFKS
jgi:hypothetical protein